MASTLGSKATSVVRNQLLAILISIGVACASARADASPLPQRAGPPVQTTTSVPHVQFGIEAVPQVHAELLRRVSALPKVHIRPTVVSLPGAMGFWLLEELPLSRPEVIVGGREFAHVHPDGSLHASLPSERALEAVAAGWAVRHPWATRREGWEGFVMLFTPQTMEELDVTFQLILDGYNFVTGKNLRAEAFRKNP